METSKHLEFKPSEVTWNSMTLEEVEKKIQEMYNYQLKMYERLYEISKIQADGVGKLKLTSLENTVGTSGNVFQHYVIYGTPVIADPTKMYILKPTILDTESKPLKWYKRFWNKLSSWSIWIHVELVLLIFLLTIALMALYGSIYEYSLN